MTADIGHNSDAFAVTRDTLGDLLAEAKLWLDGSPVADREQADGLRLLQVKIRDAHKEGDAARMAATKPHRDAETAINAEWKPILAPAKTALDVLSAALGKWQAEEQRKADEAARVAREAALQAEREAQEAFRKADAANLAEREAAERAQQEAERLAREATRAEQAKTGAQDVLGMGRRSALIVTREPVGFTDRTAALRWAKEHRPQELADALLEIVRKAKAGDVPGVAYETREKVR
jgi:hypothetical protein